MGKQVWIGLGSTACAAALALVALAFPKERAPVLKPVILVAAFAHDASAFTQGLVINAGQMFEGTGQYGKSALRRVELETGKVLENIPLANEYFGEGITMLNGRIYQLTWRENVCIVYDQATLKNIGTHRFAGEGWGLANDGKLLYLSDGTSTIRVIDPEKFNVVKRLHVRAGGKSVGRLNELEFVNGELLANVWYLDHIARISPATGEISGWLDASHLYPVPQRPSREYVLNGIAFDQVTGRLFLTGKNWPKLFEVRLPD